MYWPLVPELSLDLTLRVDWADLFLVVDSYLGVRQGILQGLKQPLAIGFHVCGKPADQFLAILV